MYKLLLIGLGGFAGALLRHIVGGLFQNWAKTNSFPYGTLAVNILGCFLIGVLSQAAESQGVLSPETRSFVFIGLLGAFTTYSTFGNESVNLMMDGNSQLSLVNVGLHLGLGLGAVWLGRVLGVFIWK